jgi:hypothetical protein
MKLQIWRRMLNLERVALMLSCFFIPALWQSYTVEPTLFCQNCGVAVKQQLLRLGYLEKRDLPTS